MNFDKNLNLIFVGGLGEGEVGAETKPVWQNVK